MKNPETLSSEDREFFSCLTQMIFVNPFSDERAQMDEKISGVPGVAKIGPGERVPLFMPRVAERFERLEQQGLGRGQAVEGEDRDLLEYGWLFYTYHRYIDALDELTQTQLDAGDEPPTVPFASEVVDELVRRGFDRGAAVRYFEMFYQLRRAFYFIAKGLVGRSPSMKRLRLALWNNVFTYDIGLWTSYLRTRMEDFSTLILGETGTGKGVAAAAIGRSGAIPFNPRTNRFAASFMHTFLAINLSQYPEGLIESELFGHRKGAFTGAVDDHDGVFSRSSAHGALFLDEIGEVSAPVQIKLLQVLQERTFSPVGSHEKRRFEGRVIAATNRPLERLRREGGMRDDFFYRLSSDIIVVPPLRTRLAEDAGELDDLIRLLVTRIVGEPSGEVEAKVCDVLGRDLPRSYPWPGNVRELEQAVRRILLTHSYSGDLTSASPEALDRLVAGIEAGSLEARELLGAYCALLYGRVGSYEQVAKRTGLDRRTVKKYIDEMRNA
jgi:two-component system, NtrC family, response regulator HydG